MNKVNTNDQLNRMKSLMNYGLKTESKQAPYSAVEYQKVGADGKVYGIVREGTKYYIKSAPNKQNLIKEDFGYIGGFRNRKDNEYTSYANAQKHFDLKMMSLKEAANNPTFNVESWDLNKKELIVTEASDKMKGEILRERQIMKNAMMIMEAKNECGDMPGLKCPTDGEKSDKDKPFTEDGTIDNQGKANIKDKSEPVINGESKNVNGQPVNEEEVLGWNRNKDYMDKSHGTEIGDSAPFDGPEARNIDDQDKKVTNTGEMKNGVVENHGTSMHDTDNQNSPAVGVGEGPSDDNNKPFDAEKGKQIDEAVGLDDDVEDVDGGEDPLADDGMEGGDPDMEGDPGLDGGEGEPVDTDMLGDEEGGEGLGDEELGDEDFDDEEELGEDPMQEDIESRISAMEDILMQIADKLGIETPGVDAGEYEDDDLFGDEEGGEDFGGDDELGAEDEFGGEEPDFGGEDLGGTPEGDFEGGEEEPEDEIEDGLNRECGYGSPMDNTFESRRRNGVQIFETKAFKRAMRKQRVNEEGMTPFKDAGRVPSGNMNKLDDFGKHPAYQKVVMDLPPKDLKEFPGNYDMNDDSVKNDTPYGEKIGDGAPFEIDPQAIDNAIAEAFDRLKKNLTEDNVPTKLYVGDEIADKINNSDTPGGAMGDMALDVPPPSADAEQGMDDMPDPTAGIGEEPPTDPVAGGPEDDPLEGDPNALSAGQGDPETQQFVQDFQNSSQSVKDRTMKYFNSQEDNGGEQPANTGMPPAPGAMPESKFNFKHIIDEVFNDIQSQNPLEKDTTRLGKTIEDGAETESRSPFIPR